MKKIWDKVLEKTKQNKKTIIFLAIFILIGLIAGSLFVAMMTKTDQQMVKEYLGNFVTSIDQNKLNYGKTVINSLIANLGFVLMIWLLGISVVGIPITLFMLFSKAFLLGFSITSILFQYQLKGILFSFVYLFPHHLINIALYIFLMIYVLSVSSRLIHSVTKKKSLDFKMIMNKYTVILGIVAVGVVITSLLETFLVPTLVKLLIPLLT